MRPHRGSLYLLFLALSVYASSSSTTTSSSARGYLITRDGGGHGHHNSHAAPLVQLNETEVTMYHSPTPPSYWSIDIDNVESDTSRHPGLMALHGILMSLAFFIALPLCKSYQAIVEITRNSSIVLAITMRSVNHAWRGAVVFIFYGLNILGCAASALYTKSTPNM